MKNIIKKNYKFIIGLTVGIIVSVVIVYAETSPVLNSIDVSYNSTSNVQKAIDDLYNKADIRKRKNFIYAYTYDKNNKNCITGDESTCIPTDCYKKGQTSCPAGTIIEYKVNDSDIVRFHVIKDDGEKLTMQSQKNTIYNTAWASKYNDGPKTILNSLENATSGWENVNSLTYSIGDKDSTLGYSGCDSKTLECNTTNYSLSKSNVKARMITVQEANTLGCKYEISGSCPIWMFNYFVNSTFFGGTKNDISKTVGYWLMSVFASNDDIFTIRPPGFIFEDDTGPANPDVGARAVVEVNKE